MSKEHIEPSKLWPRIGDGGSAFPVGINEIKHSKYAGMTLRDWFAGQALAGFMANKNRPETFDPDGDAEYVYQIADAMLKEREWVEG